MVKFYPNRMYHQITKYYISAKPYLCLSNDRTVNLISTTRQVACKCFTLVLIHCPSDRLFEPCFRLTTELQQLSSQNAALQEQLVMSRRVNNTLMTSSMMSLSSEELETKRTSKNLPWIKVSSDLFCFQCLLASKGGNTSLVVLWSFLK